MGCARVSGVGIGRVLGRIFSWAGYQAPLHKAPFRLPLNHLPSLNHSLCTEHSEKQTEHSFRAAGGEEGSVSGDFSVRERIITFSGWRLKQSLDI